MSDSPRWHLDGLPGTTGIVEVMLYDDHLAAVEEALQRGAGLAAMAWSSHMQRAVAAAEQRVTERHNAEHEDDRLAAFQNGYDAATVKERQRSVLLIADAYGKALSAARDAVAAECIAHHGYTPGQTCPYCTDALAAIDGVEKS